MTDTAPKALDAAFVKDLLLILCPNPTTPKLSIKISKTTYTINVGLVINTLIEQALDKPAVIKYLWEKLKLDLAPSYIGNTTTTPFTVKPVTTWTAGNTTAKTLLAKAGPILETFTKDAIYKILIPIRSGLMGPKPPNGSPKPVKAARGSNFRDKLDTRDKYECSITKVVSDTSSITKGIRGPLEGAHIIPHHLADSSKTLARDAIAIFAGSKLGINDASANGFVAKVNDPSNGMLLDPNCHHTFDKLQWSIEAKLQSGSTTVYEYRVRIVKNPDAGLATAKLVDLDQKNTPLTFQTGSTTIAAPNPDWCNLHLAVCRVVHAAGLADVLEAFVNDFDKPDDTAVPAPKRSLDEMQAETQELESSKRIKMTDLYPTLIMVEG
ncbi:hypothetical protein M408DRAFT_25855 [Serendipita vermifera MAFF 305830]|uniref:HNH nuclease domain-containing protein n=1 Tax=Serendipita vermifera MAFF 305830 TaxID=933852 RepID=A0A0C2WHW5_SERVB|nr:hypothetical protein M408DRAFT_25855 [Serendipita vermifera MAFF 305830]